MQSTTVYIESFAREKSFVTFANEPRTTKFSTLEKLNVYYLENCEIKLHENFSV